MNNVTKYCFIFLGAMGISLTYDKVASPMQVIMDGNRILDYRVVDPSKCNPILIQNVLQGGLGYAQHSYRLDSVRWGKNEYDSYLLTWD